MEEPKKSETLLDKPGGILGVGCLIIISIAGIIALSFSWLGHEMLKANADPEMRQKIATGLRVQRQSLISRRFDAFKAWAVRTAPLHGDIDGARRGGEHRHAHVGGPRALGQASPAPSEATTCNARTPRSFRAACQST